MIRWLFVLIIWILNYTNSYSQCHFIPPVDYEIRLSGTFGELRGNHFHTGLDIKSPNGSSGHPIRVVEDGYIQRINIKSDGYGNALYIRHACGYISVYAHLQSFESRIGDLSKKIQYSLKSFEIDTLLSDTLLPIRQGEIIGYMGNSGYSFGPHLHFEIRNAISERPINPKVLEWEYKDRIIPELKEVYVYTLDSNDDIVTKEARSTQDTIEIDGNRIGIGLEIFDRADGVSNKNGIYRIRVDLDSATWYEIRYDSLDFKARNLYLTHVDHEAKIKDRKNIYRCFSFQRQYPFVVTHQVNNGIVHLAPDTTRRISINIWDYSGNVRSTYFFLRKVGDQKNKTESLLGVEIDINKSVYLDLDSFGVFIDSFSFEKNERLICRSLNDRSDQLNSFAVQVGESTQSLLKPIKIHFKNIRTTDSLAEKIFIAKCDSDEYINCGGQIDGEYISDWVAELGQYCLMIDTLPPVIVPKKFSSNWSGLTYISFNITDNFHSEGSAKSLQYEGYLDQQWMLFEYDKKNDVITYHFDHLLIEGEHSFILKVTDAVGNSETLQKTIHYD